MIHYIIRRVTKQPSIKTTANNTHAIPFSTDQAKGTVEKRQSRTAKEESAANGVNAARGSGTKTGGPHERALGDKRRERGERHGSGAAKVQASDTKEVNVANGVSGSLPHLRTG